MFTKNSYIMFEVVSALQKDIRRGNEQGAMYWALEFLPKFEAYLWRRLLIISQEDIGLASPATVQFVTTQCQAWFTMRRLGGHGECRLVLANTILSMCRSPKSRLADHFQCVVNYEHHNARRNGKRPIPDYALDKHTLRGKRKGRGWEHFLLVGAELSPEDIDLADPYQSTAWDLWTTGKAAPNEKWPMPKTIEKQITQLSLPI